MNVTDLHKGNRAVYVDSIATVTFRSRAVQVAFTAWIQDFWCVRLCSD